MATVVPGLTDEVAVPANINKGLATPSPDFLTSLLGKPRESMTQDCRPVTNKSLSALILTASVGPFSVCGLSPAVDSLKQIMGEIRQKFPAVYSKLGTAGMLCCRLIRGSSTKISSHSWGTAIDLTLDGKLDTRGNNKTHYGLTLIAPIFNSYGWVWGAEFRTEDAMHFEVSKSTLQQWQAQGLLVGSTTSVAAATTPLAKAAGKIAVSPSVLKKGDTGAEVRLLQQKLNQHGAHLSTDGVFGNGTEKAVIAWQTKAGLAADGVVGPKTRKSLGM